MKIYIWKIPRERYWLSVLQQEYVRPKNGKFREHIKPMKLFVVCNPKTLSYMSKLNLFLKVLFVTKDVELLRCAQSLQSDIQLHDLLIMVLHWCISSRSHVRNRFWKSLSPGTDSSMGLANKGRVSNKEWKFFMLPIFTTWEITTFMRIFRAVNDLIVNWWYFA